MPQIIRPTASATSLFRAATIVASTDPNIDWSVGWALWSSCPSGTIWCCEDGDTPPDSGEQEFKPDAGTITALRFKPYTVVQVEGCDAGMARIREAQTEAENLAAARLVAYTEGWVGRALAVGVCGSPGLEDSGQNVGTFTTVAEGIAAMLADWSNDRVFERPILHLPWSLASRPEDPLVRLTDLVDIVFNPGYPPGTAYLTGRVEISIREPEVPASADGSETLQEMRTNSTQFIKERMAVHRFDPCLVRRATIGGS
jgi:hypothetical protein